MAKHPDILDLARIFVEESGWDVIAWTDPRGTDDEEIEYLTVLTDLDHISTHLPRDWDPKKVSLFLTEDNGRLRAHIRQNIGHASKEHVVGYFEPEDPGMLDKLSRTITEFIGGPVRATVSQEPEPCSKLSNRLDLRS